MAPVKNPNHNTGTVPKSTPSGSSSSSSVLETSPSGSSCISSDPNVQSASMRSNGGGLVVVDVAENSGHAVGSVVSGNVCSSMGNIAIAQPPPAVTAQATTVPQSGGIGAVGGAMTNAYVLRKNTEIVAPIRRELKDLNDYFLSVTESSAQSALPNFKRQNHHYHHRHQPPVTPLAGPSNLDGSACFDFDNFQDSPRSCYPVRPIPRRTSQPRDADNSHQHGYNHSSHPSCGIPVNSSNNNNQQAATVGVVNPTSLGIPNEDAQHPRHTNPFVRYRQPSSSNSDIIDIDDILLQRYKYIQYCIKLANKTHNKNKDIMVNENNENEIIVNSTSLEDVASSETTERAQSVTSIHSSIEPTTPTYEELQTRLEASTRNIQNMKEQQQQLMRLQDQAKQHLAEMETLRSQSVPLRRGTAANGAPEYENIEQVHTDMSSLVGRMKNLTTFIQNQNELSNLLGDDGPEILAEQQTLQQKLEGLKSHRDEMKNLILELHDINRMAERRAYEQHLQQQQKPANSEQPSGSGLAAQQETPARVVPIEYSRIVPIELVGNQQKHQQRQQQQQQEQAQVNHIPNGNVHSSEEETLDDPATAALIQQKMSDIQTMKNQLSRLKSMMETVKLIEERTEGKSPREIGLSEPGPSRSVDIPIRREATPKNTNSQQRVVGATAPFDKDRTPVQDDFIDDPDDPVITDKIHILNEVTRDLRSQAMSLASERERIRVLKEEIMRRKAANAAASTNAATQAVSAEEDKNSNRDRGSPSKLSNKERDRDLLKAQYEAKKKEFQEMCQRLQSEESATTTPGGRAREDDDEEEEDDLTANDILNQGQASAKPDLGYYYPQSQGVSCNSSVHGGTSKTRGKESADSGAADVHGGPSCEAASIKSGSSRSFSMPPPMRAMSNREASWRKASQEHFDHFAPPNAPSTTGSTGQAPPPMPPSWNPYYFYNAPYSPHFSQPPPSGVNSDCICQANQNSVSNGVVTPASSMVMQSDPVLLQQFIQTQQMLINSVCQCNQMLWHQQREIDNLNSTIHMLQERLLSHTNGTDLAATHRSESVPPAGTVQNNLCPSLNRAQSEQPHHFPSLLPHHHLPTIMSQSSSTASSFHRRNICNIQQQQQQQQQLANHATPFNFSVDHQSSGGMYSSAVNNICAPIPPMPNFNNVGVGAPTGNNNTGAPIFMHHHNNTQHPVHNNNSNLLNAAQQDPQPSASTAANVQSTQPTSVSTGASNLAGSALNNQVPPGNRANNYWDNFRSYSRQNLLSSNSCKSNEEQSHNQHQQQQQLPQQQQQQPHHVQQQQQQQHQQELPNLPVFTNSLNAGFRADSNTNNLNPPSYDNKYLHTFRNRINSNASMHSGLVAPVIASSTSSTQTTNYSNMMNIGINQQEAQQQQQGANWSSAAGVSDVFEANEQLAHDLRNMNLNFGNNEPNKVPMKPSSLRRSGNRRLRHTLSEPAAYAEQQQVAPHPDGAGDFLSPGIFSGVIESLDSAMDDTSDEIKRNLLVNALKSEKFTTKFYESLKEDVFRRIETLLRGKDSDQEFFAHLCRDNNIAATHEPQRKLYLNEVRSLSRPSDDLNETESNNGENEDEDDEEDDDEKGAKALGNHNLLNNNNSEAHNTLGLNAKDIKLLADKFVGSNASSSSIPPEQTAQFPDYELIRYITSKIHEGTAQSSVINDALLVEIAKMTATAIHNYTMIKCQKKELIEAHLHISPKKIYADLRTKLFPRDRDRFLMWYQRYLETVLYVTLKRDEDDDPQPSRENNNNTAQQSRNANQNGALSWMDIQNIYVNAHQARKSNIPIRPSATTAAPLNEVENKIENNSSIKQLQHQHQQQHQQQQLQHQQPGPFSNQQQQHHLPDLSTPTTPSSNIMNEDLAEADQGCSSTNSTMQSSADVHTDDSFLLVGAAPEPQLSHSPENAEGQLISIPSEPQPPATAPASNQNFLNFFLDEAENNENPEEESRQPSSDSAAQLHPLLADSDNAEEDGDGQNQRPESSLQGAFGTDPLAITGGTAKRNSVP